MRLVLRLALLLPLATTIACNQPAPGDGESTETAETGDSDTGDTGVPDGSELTSYYPLVDGANWTYLQKTTSGQISGTEVVDASASTWEGKDVILLTDNPDGSGEYTQSTIYRDGTAARRIHKELKNAVGAYTIVDYDPGFTRADDAWDTVGGLGELTYQRTESDGEGNDPVEETRGHDWTVNALNESVTVPAGTFSCISVTRVRTTGATAGEVVHFWFASGVGKVREERPAEGKIEELVSFDIPGGKSGG